ncbi:MAG: hypothetical protein M3R59_01495 [Verrucomicrobiota bacterium]|nr:hypothetical protein [Verrucomicrobiota bacterium]
MRRAKFRAFALYEVLIGLAIFAVGIIALGRAVGNCITASALSSDDARVRQILENRMAEVQTSSSVDKLKQFTIKTDQGEVKLVQKSEPIEMKEDKTVVTGMSRVTLTAQWQRGGEQTKQIAFYVYRAR